LDKVKQRAKGKCRRANRAGRPQRKSTGFVGLKEKGPVELAGPKGQN
jgi:hypothetical protein